jgi:hypothetical protein
LYSLGWFAGRGSGQALAIGGMLAASGGNPADGTAAAKIGLPDCAGKRRHKIPHPEAVILAFSREPF